MHCPKRLLTTLGLLVSLFLPGALAQNTANSKISNVQHVLLISVDGLHALDLANYVVAHEDSTLAFLSHQGVTYTNASTTTPSDSFPGLASLVTGGSPVTSGLWYDDTYNRALSPPRHTDGLGNPGGPCPGKIGTNVAWDESIDRDLTELDGDGINPDFLVRDPNHNCATIMPHQYLRVNTIFEVVKANGGTTAWTDKHPSYEWTNGPSGHGVDDFYGPEINSKPVASRSSPAVPQSHLKTTPTMTAGPRTCSISSATTYCMCKRFSIRSTGSRTTVIDPLYLHYSVPTFNPSASERSWQATGTWMCSARLRRASPANSASSITSSGE